MSLVLRQGGAADAPALSRIFRACILRGTKHAYSAEQRLAWAGSRPDPAAWRQRVQGIDIRILEKDGAAIGFAGMQDDCFDLLFVHPDHAGQGHARRLHDPLVAEARARGILRLTAHASHVSRPVFAHFGWQAGEEAEAERGGVLLGYTVMTLGLMGGSSARAGSGG
ncbi:GNAT family N-acetyltransferase [Mangrovicoccus ximenensis]|uniref:GNAT family N-acetyltransferase n=1 Tax=Mangrovicoccus ximenensis TaxID=1911570 RepID=UPI000D386343|nr:GNAT family N-acetyltransferase [Mangrovicoccus ximenensis]